MTSTGGPVGGETPATLQLTLGATPTFSPFIPGMAQSYTTTHDRPGRLDGDNATLSVADPSAIHTGHLVNGTYFLPAALEVGAAHSGARSRARRRSAARRPDDDPDLDRHRRRETITLRFKQNIAVTDALRTGAYAKTLTFTLSRPRVRRRQRLGRYEPSASLRKAS